MSISSFFRTIPPDSLAQRVWISSSLGAQLEPPVGRVERDAPHVLGPEHAVASPLHRDRAGHGLLELGGELSTNALRSLESARSEAASRSRSTPALSDDTKLRLLDVFRPVTAAQFGRLQARVQLERTGPDPDTFG